MSTQPEAIWFALHNQHAISNVLCVCVISCSHNTRAAGKFWYAYCIGMFKFLKKIQLSLWRLLSQMAVIFDHTVVCLNITFVVSMYAVFIQFQNNNTNLESQTGTEYIQINSGVRSQVETLRTAQTDTQRQKHI